MIYLVMATLINGASPILKKIFKKDCIMFFSSVLALFACLFFVLVSRFQFDFNVRFLPYSLLFAISYSICTIFGVLAFKNGSLMITGLIFSFSLLLPTFYGLIAYGEKSGVLFWIGLLLLCVSLICINIKSTKKRKSAELENIAQGDKCKVNIKYLIFLFLSFVGNGCCSIFQTAEQKAFNGAYKSEFMIIALLSSAILLFVFSFIKERKEIKSSIKESIILGGASGILNGLLNLCVMFSVNAFPTSIVFPIICGGALIVNYLLAVIFFKEKYTKVQYIGLFVGFLSVILLNL